MLYRILALVGFAAFLSRGTTKKEFNRGWGHGWREGFACGISATEEEIEEVFPSEEDELSIV